jgi:hypothetical protein
LATRSGHISPLAGPDVLPQRLEFASRRQEACASRCARTSPGYSTNGRSPSRNFRHSS